jgi:hypothetical protein
VLTNTITQLWPAMQWTPEQLAQRVVELTGVKTIARRAQGRKTWGDVQGLRDIGEGLR